MVRESTLAETWNAMRVWHIRFDQTRNYINRRTLCGQQHVYTGGARFLCQPRDEFFDLLADDHHHVGKFIDDNDDIRQRCQCRMLDRLCLRQIERWRREGSDP